MKIDQTTIDAVNNAIREAGAIRQDNYGDYYVALDADDISALILVLAKCEPVKGLVEALQLVSKRGEIVQRSDDYMFEVLDVARSALAPFTEGGAG